MLSSANFLPEESLLKQSHIWVKEKQSLGLILLLLLLTTTTMYIVIVNVIHNIITVVMILYKTNITQ